MKLVFKKDEDSEISVFQKVEGHEQAFSYVEMIKALIDSREMELPEISEGFTDAEKSSIKSMVTYINKAIATADDTGSGE